MKYANMYFLWNRLLFMFNYQVWSLNFENKRCEHGIPNHMLLFIFVFILFSVSKNDWTVENHVTTLWLFVKYLSKWFPQLGCSYFTISTVWSAYVYNIGLQIFFFFGWCSYYCFLFQLYKKTYAFALHVTPQ